MVTKDGTTQWMVTRSMGLSPCTQESKYQSKRFVFFTLLDKKDTKKPKINIEMNSLLVIGQKPLGQCLIHAWVGERYRRACVCGVHTAGVPLGLEAEARACGVACRLVLRAPARRQWAPNAKPAGGVVGVDTHPPSPPSLGRWGGVGGGAHNLWALAIVVQDARAGDTTRDPVALAVRRWSPSILDSWCRMLQRLGRTTRLWAEESRECTLNHTLPKLVAHRHRAVTLCVLIGIRQNGGETPPCWDHRHDPALGNRCRGTSCLQAPGPCLGVGGVPHDMHGGRGSPHR